MNIEDYIEDANLEEVKTFEIRATFKMIAPKEDGFDEYNLDQFLADSLHLAEALDAGKAEFRQIVTKRIEK